MKKWITILFMLLLASWLSVALLYLVAYLQPIPMLGQSERLQILDIEQSVYYETNFEKKSNWIDYEEIPGIIKSAFVAVEDKRFYLHYGLDPIRIAKSILVNIQNPDSVPQGGSTITQQYSRNLFLNQELTLKRKLVEAYYAIQIEMHYSKEQILEGYLNTLYFGHGVYGIRNAASFFYAKEVGELSIAEVATLVGICNAPSYYSPYINLESSTKRRAVVLYAMVQNKVITEKDYEEARNTPIAVVPYTEKSEDQSLSSYYRDGVIAQLKTLGLLSDAALAKGLVVETYYDPYIQRKLTSSIRKSGSDVPEMEVSGVVVEPFTGKVLALSGGKDYTVSQFNRALYSQRQIASTVKPLLYYLAIDQGFTPSSRFLSQPTTFQLSEMESYAPTNFNDAYPYKEISMIQALGVSDNIYAVKTHMFLGTSSLYHALLNFGMKQTKDIAALALGSVNLSALELASIYNTFASEGLYVRPQMIHRVTDLSGNLIYERTDVPRRLLDRNQTLIVNQLLRSPFDIKNQGYTVPSLLGYEPRVITGAKSGTSNWDSWIAGFNPDYTVVIWNGYDESKEMKTLKERRISRLIYRDLFNSLYKDESEGPWYTISDELVSLKVNPLTGFLDNHGSYYWYDRKGSLPTLDMMTVNKQEP